MMIHNKSHNKSLIYAGFSNLPDAQKRRSRLLFEPVNSIVMRFRGLW